MKRRSVFYSLAAQPSNLGDIEIRNSLLSWIREAETPIVLFVGSMPSTYLDAFDIPTSATLVRNPVLFQLRLWQAIFRGRAHLVFAPGPQLFGVQKGSTFVKARDVSRLIAKTAINLLNTAMVRCSGGQVLTIGRAVRGDIRTALMLERARARLSNGYFVRDTLSSCILGMHVKTIPDLAFSNAGSLADSKHRCSVVFSLRGDQPLDDSYVKAAVNYCRREGLDPVFVTQVQGDESRHRELAQAHTCSHIDWGERSHREQMERVKAAYRGARFVVSDRLHALIFGCQAGAVPVMLLRNGSDKLPSTLLQLVPTISWEIPPNTWLDLSDQLRNAPEPATIRARIIEADKVLQMLRSEVVEALRR